MRRFGLSIPDIEEIEALDLLTKFIFLTIIRFFLEMKDMGILKYSPRFAFRIDIFYTHYRKFCSEYRELCELYVTADAVARCLKILSNAGLISGGLSQDKNLWEYSTNVALEEAEELLNYHIRQIPSDEHKQLVFDIKINQSNNSK